MDLGRFGPCGCVCRLIPSYAIISNFANASSKIDDVNVLHHISATRVDIDIILALDVLLATIVILNTQKSNNALRCGCS